MSRSKERKSLYALRHLIVKAGFNYKEAKRNKNFEVISIGVELGFLTESDIKFMLDKNTSEIMAGNRLIKRRHEYYGES
jgi:hypothetical protein